MSDSTFKVSTTDTTDDHAENKLIAGDGVSIAKVSTGGYEALEFSINGSVETIVQVIQQDGYYSQVSATDTTPEFLGTKLVAGDNITITTSSNGGVERLTIAAPQVDISGLDLTVTEHNNEFSQALESVLKELDGYGSNLGQVNSYLIDQTQLNQTVLKTLDGYTTDLQQGLDVGTYTENKINTDEAIHQLRVAADGYAIFYFTNVTANDPTATGDGYLAFFTGVGANIAGDNDLYYNRETGVLSAGDLVTNTITGIDEIDFTPGGNKLITGLGEVRGYTTGLRISGTNAGPGATLTLVGANDGSGTIYFGTDQAASYVEGTHTLTVNTINASQNISIGGDILNATLSETFQTIRTALDGYATTLGTLVSEATFQANKAYEQEAIHQITIATDAYGSSLAVLNSKEEDQTRWNQSVLQALDGYQTSINGLVSETTFQDNKNYTQETIHQLTVAADGYQTQLNATVSEATFQANKAYEQEAIHQITAALDGYATTATTNTITNNVALLQSQQVDQTQWNQSVKQSIDAYGLNPFITGSAITATLDHSAVNYVTHNLGKAYTGFIILNNTYSPCSFSAHMKSNQAITDNTSTTINFDLEDWDLGGDYNSATSSFVAPVDGYYFFDAWVETTTTIAAGKFAQLFFTRAGAGFAVQVVTGAGFAIDINTSSYRIGLVSGQSVLPRFYQFTGGNVTLASTVGANFKGGLIDEGVWIDSDADTDTTNTIPLRCSFDRTIKIWVY